jgi:PAS domain-containing protein
LLERWRSILAAGEPGEIEARLRRFDGEYRWFLFRTRPLFDASGRVVKWCGINTEFESPNWSLEARSGRWWLSSPAREHHFRSILDDLPALITLMTPDGEIELANRQVLEYFDKTLEELKEWATSDAVHPDDLPAVLVAWKRSVDTGKPYHITGDK